MIKDAKKKYHVKGGDGITLEFQRYFRQLACPEIKWNKKNKKVLKQNIMTISHKITNDRNIKTTNEQIFQI